MEEYIKQSVLVCLAVDKMLVFRRDYCESSSHQRNPLTTPLRYLFNPLTPLLFQRLDNPSLSPREGVIQFYPAHPLLHHSLLLSSSDPSPLLPSAAPLVIFTQAKNTPLKSLLLQLHYINYIIVL